jgi:hypothetical protein
VDISLQLAGSNANIQRNMFDTHQKQIWILKIILILQDNFTPIGRENNLDFFVLSPHHKVYLGVFKTFQATARNLV